MGGQFSHCDCKSVDVQYPGTKLPNPQGALSKEILADVCHTHIILCVWCVMYVARP